MDNRIFFPLQPQGYIQSAKSNKPITNAQSQASDFGAILESKLKQDLKFSHHAQQRLQSRNIKLNSADLDKIQAAVKKAHTKGAKDSLILMDDLAFIVSIKNSTVITALDGASIKDNLFTNIDSAVII